MFILGVFCLDCCDLFSVEGKQLELAASLAEKYYDFEILIQLCELSDNTERIEKYLRQFSDRVSSNGDQSARKTIDSV